MSQRVVSSFFKTLCQIRKDKNRTIQLFNNTKLLSLQESNLAKVHQSLTSTLTSTSTSKTLTSRNVDNEKRYRFSLYCHLQYSHQLCRFFKHHEKELDNHAFGFLFQEVCSSLNFLKGKAEKRRERKEKNEESKLLFNEMVSSKNIDVDFEIDNGESNSNLYNSQNLGMDQSTFEIIIPENLNLEKYSPIKLRLEAQKLLSTEDFKEIVHRLSTNMNDYSLHDKLTFLTAILSLNLFSHARNLFPQIKKDFIQNLDNCRSKEVSMFLCASARLQEVPDPDLFASLSQRMIQFHQSNYMNYFDFVLYVWALSKLSLPLPLELQQEIRNFSLNNFEFFNPTQIALLCWAFSKSKNKYPPTKDFLRLISDHWESRLNQFSTSFLTNVLECFATYNYSSPSFFRAATKEITKKSNQLTPHEISSIAWAFGKLKISDPNLFQKFVETSSKKLKQFEPSQLSSLVWSLGRVYYPCESFFDLISKEAITQLSTMNEFQMTSFIWAMGNFRLKECTSIWNIFSHKLVHQAQNLKPSEILTIFISSIRCSYRNPALMMRLSEEVLSNFHLYDLNQLDQISKIVIKSGIKTHPLLDKINHLRINEKMKE